MGISSGQFEWKLNGVSHQLRPNDILIVCPGVQMEKEFRLMELGSFYKISLDYKLYDGSLQSSEIVPGFKHAEFSTIISRFVEEKFFILDNGKAIMDIFMKMEEEFTHTEVGFKSRVAALVDNLIILAYRNFVSKNQVSKPNANAFEELSTKLKRNLSHNWTVKEMAAVTKMGVTQFTDKLKVEMGYSPFDYLIYLRINEAVRLITETDISLTNIAMDTGFYSSQHFSNSFKKVMGHSPRNFRKNAI